MFSYYLNVQAFSCKIDLSVRYSHPVMHHRTSLQFAYFFLLYFIDVSGVVIAEEILNNYNRFEKQGMFAKFELPFVDYNELAAFLVLVSLQTISLFSPSQILNWGTWLKANYIEDRKKKLHNHVLYKVVSWSITVTKLFLIVGIGHYHSYFLFIRQ